MDENEEAMARIQMAVDDWQKNQEQDEQDPVLGSSNANPSAHWQLGSADPRVTTVRMEAGHQRNPLFRDFNLKLREYLARHHPSHFVRPDQDIQARATQSLPRKKLKLICSHRRSSRAKFSMSTINPKLTGSMPGISSAATPASTRDLDMIPSFTKPRTTT
jgi:hypothetical protein